MIWPPSRGCPGRLWSLWDIMKQFNMRGFSFHLKTMRELESACDLAVRAAGQAPPSTMTTLRNGVVDVINKVKALADDVGLPETKSKAGLTALHYASDGGNAYGLITASSLGADLRNLTDVLMSEIWRYQFLLVDRTRSNYIDNKDLLGDKVAAKFKSAVPDIKEAGNCLAADCNTAAVFHLMRAVEWGMRAFAVHLGFKTLKPH